MAWSAVSVEDDPLVRMCGAQPGGATTLEGRSDPPNALAMTGVDHGVQSDFCHNVYNPFFEATHNLARAGDLNGALTVTLSGPTEPT